MTLRVEKMKDEKSSGLLIKAFSVVMIPDWIPKAPINWTSQNMFKLSLKEVDPVAKFSQGVIFA